MNEAYVKRPPKRIWYFIVNHKQWMGIAICFVWFNKQIPRQ